MHAKDTTMTPLEKVEALFDELVRHYGASDDREIRAAAKILLVGLAKFKEHGGQNWSALLDDYVSILKHDPEKFKRVLQSNRGANSRKFFA